MISCCTPKTGTDQSLIALSSLSCRADAIADCLVDLLNNRFSDISGSEMISKYVIETDGRAEKTCFVVSSFVLVYEASVPTKLG